jgi:hypothetical protein
MTTSAAELEKLYFTWLRKEYSFTDLENNVVKIDTPFLDSDFDYIVLYAQSLRNGKIVLTDDGWTIDNLQSAGLSLSKRSVTRRHLIEEIATSFGVEINLDTKNISLQTTLEDFAEAKHRLLMAIMRINDLLFLSPANVASSFVDDIQELLDSQNVFYTPNILVPAMSGLTVHFDFSIPQKKDEEKLVRAISSPNNLNGAKLASYDINLASRTRKAKYIVLLNDKNKKITNTPALTAIADDSSYPFNFKTMSEAKKDSRILANAG